MIGRYLNFALILPVLLLPSCLPTRVSAPNSQVRANSVADFKPSQLHPREYSGRIAELEKLASDTRAGRKEKLQALHQLVLLHLAPNNPESNPAKASAALTAWLEASQPGPDTEEGSIWLSLLREYLEKDKALVDSARQRQEDEKSLNKLADEKRNLLHKLANLEDSNQELKEKIEKLKLIDLTVERKRKSMP